MTFSKAAAKQAEEAAAYLFRLAERDVDISMDVEMMALLLFETEEEGHSNDVSCYVGTNSALVFATQNDESTNLPTILILIVL